MNNILVSVLMPAYNHEKYIAQAIESFLSQKGIGASDAELLIGNDASTDNTFSIARHYADMHPERIKLFSHPRNKGLLSNYKYLMEQARGRYIAILESDDFYTDELKLDKQVRYLDTNPNCSLVFTSCTHVDEHGVTLGVKQADECLLPNNNGALYKSVLFSNPVIAVTACFRKSLFNKHCNVDDFINRKFVTFDYPVWIAMANAGDFYSMRDVTASYRVGVNSISNNDNYEKRELFFSGIDKIIEYSIDKFGYTNCGDIRDLWNERLVKHALLALAFGRFERYYYFCKSIKLSGRMKWILIKYFPALFKFKKRRIIGTGAVSALTRRG